MFGDLEEKLRQNAPEISENSVPSAATLFAVASRRRRTRFIAMASAAAAILLLCLRPEQKILRTEPAPMIADGDHGGLAVIGYQLVVIRSAGTFGLGPWTVTE